MKTLLVLFLSLVFTNVSLANSGSGNSMSESSKKPNVAPSDLNTPGANAEATVRKDAPGRHKSATTKKTEVKAQAPKTEDTPTRQ